MGQVWGVGTIMGGKKRVRTSRNKGMTGSDRLGLMEGQVGRLESREGGKRVKIGRGELNYLATTFNANGICRW